MLPVTTTIPAVSKQPGGTLGELADPAAGSGAIPDMIQSAGRDSLPPPRQGVSGTSPAGTPRKVRDHLAVSCTSW
jgi:hypothetical protein